MEFTIKFCPCNFDEELSEVKEKLEQLSHVEVIEERCLLYCGQCLVQPFALVNGENVVSDNPNELLSSIIERVGEPKMKCVNSEIKTSCRSCAACTVNR
ncbi:DUF1450 domain-containing protein [Priestia megaterium]|uniref:DUF1450 domain-containing protein n=1 Tax=Priestia megaterium TaxID=1404 RepID=UPI0027953495|nr:DUF1450 domain-containing protein [Priestia megaterium]